MCTFYVIMCLRFTRGKNCFLKVRPNLLSFAQIPLCSLSMHSNFNTSVRLTKQRLFMNINHTEEENEAAHRIMENNASYAGTVRRNPKFEGLPKPAPIDCNDIYRTFHEVTTENLSKNDEMLDLNNSKFSGCLCGLSRNLSSATFDEIVHTLCCLCLWPFIARAPGPNVKILWHMLDRECTMRLGQWTVPQKLIVADYWFHLRLSPITKYNFSMIKDLIQKQNSLSPSELVQLVFCISIQRNVPLTLLNCLQNRLSTILSEVSIKELSIICLGFFKTENPISNLGLLKEILDRVTANMAELDSVNIVAVLKCARKSFKPHYIALYLKFLQECARNCNKWDIYGSVHAALLCSATFVFEPALLENAIEKFSQVMHESRVKDISKILQCLSLFNYLPHSKFNDLVFDGFLKKREKEIQLFPREFVYLAVYYSYMGYYNYEVLNQVFSPELVNKIPDCEKNAFALLDYSIEIECEDYNLLRLPKLLRNHIVAKKREEVLENSPTGMAMKSISYVMETLEKFDGLSSNICTWQVLPHMMTPDIIIRLNPKPDALPLFDYLKKHSKYEIVRPPHEEVWACLMIGGIYSYAYNSKKLVGIVVMKQRQLEKLGYRVIFLNSRSIPIDPVHRRVFLKTKLSEFVEDGLLSSVALA